MAFAKDTKILTDKGWKLIQDIAGRDRVLVRNFIGDAEFIQPFALKRRHYQGDLIKLGSSRWDVTVTPDHTIAYETVYNNKPVKHKDAAENIKVSTQVRIMRQFRYMTSATYKKEALTKYTDFGKSYTTIPNEDWFVLVAYVIGRAGMPAVSRYRRALRIHVDAEKVEKEVELLGDILDRLGIDWSYVASYTDGRDYIAVSAKNTLASRLITRLGTHKRKEMFIPDKMIYNSEKKLVDLFFNTLIESTKRPETEVGNGYQYHSNNKKLIDSLEMMATIWGYGTMTTITVKKGTPAVKGFAKKDVYCLTIGNPSKSYSPVYKEKILYNGEVYEIDLFDGEVYTKTESMPVWVSPK